jgi:hypothetical protein
MLARACVRACMSVLGRGRVHVHSACSLANSECNAYAPYCDVICGLCLHYRFRHYLINGAIFVKKVFEHKMCVLIFSTTLFETFLIQKGIQRHIAINVKTCSCKVPVILVGF